MADQIRQAPDSAAVLGTDETTDNTKKTEQKRKWRGDRHQTRRTKNDRSCPCLHQWSGRGDASRRAPLPWGGKGGFETSTGKRRLGRPRHHPQPVGSTTQKKKEKKTACYLGAAAAAAAAETPPSASAPQPR